MKSNKPNYTGREQEIGSDYSLNYNVDIAMCIDATGSMGRLINTVKKNTLSFYMDLTGAMEAKGKHIDELRASVIAFRNYIADGERAMLATDFYSLPAGAVEFGSMLNLFV